LSTSPPEKAEKGLFGFRAGGLRDKITKKLDERLGTNFNQMLRESSSPANNGGGGGGEFQTLSSSSPPEPDLPMQTLTSTSPPAAATSFNTSPTNPFGGGSTLDASSSSGSGSGSGSSKKKSSLVSRLKGAISDLVNDSETEDNSKL
jgi:hypothetical protein